MIKTKTKIKDVTRENAKKGRTDERRKQNSSARGRGMSDEGKQKVREGVVRKKNKQINRGRSGRKISSREETNKKRREEREKDSCGEKVGRRLEGWARERAKSD